MPKARSGDNRRATDAEGEVLDTEPPHRSARGIWMMAVLGFAGLTMDEDGIQLDPQLPQEWQSLAFSVQWRGRHLSISIDWLSGGQQQRVALARAHFIASISHRRLSAGAS
jgi:trehalose/maltose hydrolase-like predicted phosphorylase